MTNQIRKKKLGKAVAASGIALGIPEENSWKIPEKELQNRNIRERKSNSVTQPLFLN